jgi:tryptophan synthase alpha chain
VGRGVEKSGEQHGERRGEQHATGAIYSKLISARDSGRKSLCCYLMGGMSPDWQDVARAIENGGADVIEIGLPFSDPMIDGPVIQRASKLSLDSGHSPMSVIDSMPGLDMSIPVAVMTYYNIIYRAGLYRMAGRIANAGISGSIIADLPVEESESWVATAGDAGIENIMLVAPTTSPDRTKIICDASQGFVYCVGTMGVTGERDELPNSAKEVAAKVKAATDKPTLVGIGVSTPSQAASVCAIADGVILGSAIVRRVTEGEGARGIENFVRLLRNSID